MGKFTNSAIVLFFITISLHAKEEEIISILPFCGQGFEIKELVAIAESLRHSIQESNSYNVMERISQQEVLHSKGIVELHSCDELACALVMGEFLSIRYIVQGKVGRIENTLTCNIRFIDSKEEVILEDITEYFSGKTENFISKIIPKIAKKIVRVKTKQWHMGKIAPSQPKNTVLANNQKPISETNRPNNSNPMELEQTPELSQKDENIGWVSQDSNVQNLQKPEEIEKKRNTELGEKMEKTPNTHIANPHSVFTKPRTDSTRSKQKDGDNKTNFDAFSKDLTTAQIIQHKNEHQVVINMNGIKEDLIYSTAPVTISLKPIVKQVQIQNPIRIDENVTLNQNEKNRKDQTNVLVLESLNKNDYKEEDFNYPSTFNTSKPKRKWFRRSRFRKNRKLEPHLRNISVITSPLHIEHIAENKMEDAITIESEYIEQSPMNEKEIIYTVKQEESEKTDQD